MTTTRMDPVDLTWRVRAWDPEKRLVVDETVAGPRLDAVLRELEATPESYPRFAVAAC